MMNGYIVTFDKSNEDIPTLVVSRECMFVNGPGIDVIKVITGDEATKIWNKLGGKVEETKLITNDTEESKAAKVVFDKLCKCSLFCGKYDAKHGNIDFMNGIGIVMIALAFMVSEECGEDFIDTFAKNLIKSKKNK